MKFEELQREQFERGVAQGIAQGMETGRREGLEAGQRKLRELADMQAWLKAQNRIDDIMRSISDEAFRYQMIREYKAAADR